MKNPIRNIVLLFLAVMLTAGIFYRAGFFKKEEAKKEADGKPQAKPPAVVRAYIVKKEVLEDKISAVGSVMSNEEVNLTCEASGKVTEIHFKEGSPVSKGQLLVQLNDTELQSQLHRATVQKELLEKKKQRDEQLHAREGISDEAYESSVADYAGKVAEIDVIKSQLAKMRIYAPFSGLIGLRYVSEGGYVTPTTTIASLVDYNKVKIDFTIPEKYMGSVSKGSKVLFTVAGRDKEYESVVYAIDPRIEASTRTIRIRAICDNPGNEILPGAFANVKIVLNRLADAMMIPTQALVPELDIKKVYRLKEGKAEAVTVETGIRTEDRVQIIKGLSEGDSVISSGIMQIKPGGKVNLSGVEAN